MITALLFSLVLGPAARALDADFSVLLENEFRALTDSPANPGNRIAEFPSRLHQAELRAELNQNAGPLSLTARPRAEARIAKVNGSSDASADLFLQEAFVRASLSDGISVSWGRIQFGWGPAESVTPSNWLAPEIQLQASPYYEQLGYYRAQANVTIGQGLSLVAAQELRALNDRWANDNTPRETYRRRNFLKGEASWDHSNKVFGLVGGQERRGTGERWRAGSYGSYTLNDAWQLYYDGVLREQDSGHTWKPLVVGGVRYTLLNGAELHLEGIQNSGGFTQSERRAAESTLGNFSDITLRDILVDRGTSLLGRTYAYAGFGWPNPSFFPAWAQTPVLHLRALHSLTDHSTSLLGAAEVGFRDHYTLAAYAAFGFGAPGSEMRQLFRELAGVIGKVSF